MSKKLWFDRLQEHILTWAKYAKYILSGHILIVLFFLFGFLAAKYEQWVTWLTINTPITIIACVLLALVITYGSIQTFLKRADIVFLLPLEKQMYRYFINSFFYSFFVQAVGLFIVVFLLIPIMQYQEKYIANTLIFVGCVFGLKILSLLLNFLNTFIFSEIEKKIYKIILLIINFLVLKQVITSSSFSYLILMHVLLCSLTIVIARKQRLPWLQLIENDQKLSLKFFQLVNMFVDVPLLNHRLHERRYIPIRKKYLLGSKSISYLAARTFIRMDDYAGIFLRITFLAALFLMYIKVVPVQLVVILVCLYATGLQLLPIKQRYNFFLWFNIYPFNKSEMFKEVSLLIRNILFIQLLFLCMFVLFNSFWASLLCLGSGVTFIFIFLIIVLRKSNK